MASSSDTRHEGGAGRLISNAASTLFSDFQSLSGEIRQAQNLMKEIGVDLEKDNQSEMVKELENSVAELMGLYEKCSHYSSAIQSFANAYQPGSQSTDFSRLLEHEYTKIKGSSVSQNHQPMRRFREAIWSVHHAGEPMPGEEDEDIVMTSTQCLLNTKCPVSGKPITELAEPVRSMDCKHIYEKEAIMTYITKSSNHCPVAGCPKKLLVQRVVCDTMLLVDIDEMRATSKKNESNRAGVIEDFTALDEEEEEEEED